MTSPAEIERLLHHMPTVAERAGETWAKDFARSIIGQSRRRGWKPTDKQLPVMQRLVSELFTHRCMDPDDIQVIEG